MSDGIGDRDVVGGIAAVDDEDDPVVIVEPAFLAVDLDASGTFTATDFVIEITGAALTSVTTASFI